jgi:iron uptake system component EfeO
LNRLATSACSVAVASLVIGTSGCSLTTSNAPARSSGGTGTIDVASSSSTCKLTSTKAPSGSVVFKVKNTGSEVTEFYLYGSDGMRIVGEIENVGPGISRDLVVSAEPGDYITACKPGMKGQGLRSRFTVTDSGTSTAIKGVDQSTIDAATAQYAAYVKDQSQELVDQTTQFVNAYKSGDVTKARALFPRARGHYERIEPVAESFGDLDPELDLREADLQNGQRWTGWHRLEKDLWPPAKGYQPLDTAGRTTYGDNLLANTRLLQRRVQTTTYTVDQIGNGSKGLLDEVASSKITGEEDTWSHTDLYDFQANVDGARVGFEGLKPLLEVKNPGLAKQIESAFSSLQALLDKYKKGGDGFVFYDQVTEPQRKELSDAVNALAEPLSKMTGAITL